MKKLPSWFTYGLRAHLCYFPNADSYIEYFELGNDCVCTGRKDSYGFEKAVSLKTFMNYVSLYNNSPNDFLCYYSYDYYDLYDSGVFIPCIRLEFERKL